MMDALGDFPQLFPAPAGMIPLVSNPCVKATAFPRTRGDDPRT